MDHGYLLTLCIHLTEIPTSPQNFDKTRNQINDTFLFQNIVKVKVVGEVSEK